MIASDKTLITGDGRSVTVSSISQSFRQGAGLSIPQAGRIQKLSGNDFSLTSIFNTLDCDAQEHKKNFKIYTLSAGIKENVGRCIDSVRCVSGLNRVSDMNLTTSENGRFTARLVGSKEPNSKKQFLEIWDQSRHLKTVDISELDVHGPINTESTFASFSWCPFGEQDKLLYVCQRKPKKNSSFFKQDRSGQNGEFGQDYIHREDWGECLTEIEHTMVGVLDVSNDCRITVIDLNEYSLAKPKWVDNGTKILSVAYAEEPRRLGLIYCNNKPSKIVIHDLLQSPPSLVYELNREGYSLHTTGVSNGGDKFVYLSRKSFGPHYNTVRIHVHDLKANEDRELVDTTTGERDYFVDNLPENCFTSDDKHILFTKEDNLIQQLCLFSLDNSRLTKIKFPTTSVSILDFRYDIILASGSDVNSTTTLFVAVLGSSNAGELAWHQIEESIHIDTIDYDQHKIPTADGASYVNAITISPNLNAIQKDHTGDTGEDGLVRDPHQLPTIICVHGGPHAAFRLAHMPALIFYARLGLKTILINYRGSSGISDEYVQQLCGKIGQMDVGDCMHVIRYFVQNKLVDPKKLIISGGSHGGFLACHLTCQDEFKFTSAIIRNPALSLVTMHETTDIPEWCSAEGLGHSEHDFTRVPDVSEVQRMFEISPFSRISRANVPTLMLLGSTDQRVKMYNGLRWYELLKAKGVDTMCKVYQDKHDLGRAEVYCDWNISSIIWMLTHLNRSS